MAQISVDVDLNDIEAEDLIDEIKERLNPHNYERFTEKQKSDLVKALKIKPEEPVSKLIVSLSDKIKLEHFAKVYRKYSIEEIEKALPES